MSYHWDKTPEYTNLHEGKFNLTLNLKFHPMATWLSFWACSDSDLQDKECIEEQRL